MLLRCCERTIGNDREAARETENDAGGLIEIRDTLHKHNNHRASSQRFTGTGATATPKHTAVDRFSLLHITANSRN